MVFQIETPAALIAVASAGDEAAGQTAHQVAAMTAQLPAATPAGTRFGVHVCLGDLNHKSMVGMRDITPAVPGRERDRRRLASRPDAGVHARAVRRG